MFIIYLGYWLTSEISQKANKGKEDLKVLSPSTFLLCYSLTKKIRSFDSSGISGLTSVFINELPSAPEKRKLAVSTACSSTQEEDYFKTSGSPPPSFLQTLWALTAVLALPHPINKTLSKSLSVTSQQEPSGTQVKKAITTAAVIHRRRDSKNDIMCHLFFPVPIQEALTRKAKGQQHPAAMSERRYLFQALLVLLPGQHYLPLRSQPGIPQLPSQSRL